MRALATHVAPFKAADDAVGAAEPSRSSYNPALCQVSPKTETIKGIADTFEFEARGYSVSWLRLELASAPAAVASA